MHCHRLPNVTEATRGDHKPLVVHVACLTFYPEGSLKGNPEVATVLRLMEEILADGFVSASEPLLVVQDARIDGDSEDVASPWGNTAGAMRPFTLGYAKGQARATTLLAILSVCRDKSVSLAEAPLVHVGLGSH